MHVKLHGIAHQFPGQHFLFRELNTTLLTNRVYALVGSSGSGKSTLLSILTGWLRPTEGSISYEGIVRIGWVFQNPHGVPHRSAIDHVIVPLLARGLYRNDAKKRAGELLSDFDLAHIADRPFCALSGGEAQRLMLARGIAAKPHLFLVDEPTAQLDTHTAQTVNKTLQSLARMETIVVVATHDPCTRDSCTDIIDLSRFS
ncbi:MAG: ATP-binding cassette domain-containing protein [Propionibacteriaceae bacterium]|jgi:putative ABC transport system ATP-binding protein|nr:ATP-binding cassette domain-containing protein [Propionibacteriaceae bacterium]